MTAPSVPKEEVTCARCKGSGTIHGVFSNGDPYAPPMDVDCDLCAGTGAMTDVVQDLRTEADLCRNETADDIAVLLDRAADEIIGLRMVLATIRKDARSDGNYELNCEIIADRVDQEIDP